MEISFAQGRLKREREREREREKKERNIKKEIERERLDKQLALRLLSDAPGTLRLRRARETRDPGNLLEHPSWNPKEVKVAQNRGPV